MQSTNVASPESVAADPLDELRAQYRDSPSFGELLDSRDSLSPGELLAGAKQSVIGKLSVHALDYNLPRHGAFASVGLFVLMLVATFVVHGVLGLVLMGAWLGLVLVGLPLMVWVDWRVLNDVNLLAHGEKALGRPSLFAGMALSTTVVGVWAYSRFIRIKAF